MKIYDGLSRISVNLGVKACFNMTVHMLKLFALQFAN